MSRFSSLRINIATFVTGLVFFQCQPAQSQEKYITPWFQFEMASGWSKINQGEQPPEFPSIFSPSYNGYQANVKITFGGPVTETLAELAKIKQDTFNDVLPGHTVLANRFFNTEYGFAANEYYVDFQGNRFRYIDVLVPYEGANFLGSFRASMPSTDSSKTTDQEVLQMLNSVRPIIDGPKITTHPQSQQVKDGATLVLNVAVTSETDYTVNWYRDGIPLGRTGNTLQITNFRQTNAGDYWAIAENFAGEDRSKTATVAWEPAGNPPEFTIQPISQQIQEGESLTLTIEVISSEGYETIWYKDGIPLGATGTSLNITSIRKNDEGRYWAVASNPYGQARSAIAKVDILDVPLAPIFIAHPESQIITTGQSVSLSVEVDSDDPYTLQWFKDGNSVQSVDEILRINDAQLGDSGSYWAIASNIAGSIKSNLAVVSVIPDANHSKIFYADEFSFSILPTWQEVQTGVFYNSLIGPLSAKGSPMLSLVPDFTSGEGQSLKSSKELFIESKFPTSIVIDEGNLGEAFLYSLISSQGLNYLISSVELQHQEGDKYLHGYCYIPDITVFGQILNDISVMLNGIVTNFNQERVLFKKVFYPNQDEFLDGHRTVITWLGDGGIFGGTFKKDRDSSDEFFISDGETFIHIPTFTSIVRDGVTLDVVHSRDGFDDRVLYVSPSMDLAYGNVTLEVGGFSYGPVSWKWTSSEGMKKLFPTDQHSFKRVGTYNLFWEPKLFGFSSDGLFAFGQHHNPLFIDDSGLPIGLENPREFDRTGYKGEAISYNVSTGAITYLDDFPEGITSSGARDISQDGNIVVGTGRSPLNSAAIWEPLLGISHIPSPSPSVYPNWAVAVSWDGIQILWEGKVADGHTGYIYNRAELSHTWTGLYGVYDMDDSANVVIGKMTRPSEVFRDGAIWTTYAGANWLKSIINSELQKIPEVYGVSPDGTYIYGHDSGDSYIAHDPSARWVPSNWGGSPHQSVISHGLELRRNLQTDEIILSVNERYLGKIIVLEQSIDVSGIWEPVAGPMVYPSPDFFNIKPVAEKGYFRVRTIPEN